MKPITKKKIQTIHGTFEYAQSGQGSPAVIFINGGSGPIEGWYKVFHETAQETSVFAYNRLGVSGSDKPHSPQHGNEIVASLVQVLADIELPPPYILVGHSLGGLYANLFARLFPDQVAGVVLLDSSHPQDLIINDTQNAFIRGINRLLAIFDFLSPHRKWNEVHFVEQTVQQIELAGPFPDRPLFVVSGNKKPPMMPEHVMEIRRKNQLGLVQLSTHGHHVLASHSGHFPQLTEPDIVIQTIQKCIQLAVTHDTVQLNGPIIEKRST
ncbi:Pimeloyl-ACP methyl ester carboxylesterase [Paenibacillus algorifonticola]|uniref:Pimeloyl-ACP methyl ester carboxylesterase n=1 Tax=Paenibacillus algorifonticola TaxID=684063 RepID=A0A1I2DMP7_9BACL|nr:alpha/beta hydrolase [Paenibacillus algorifonticola]SFE81601.1 Pimeloyl-ACP methyl ester carboxylesterase [Paenibacillus algorifonticola]